MWTSLFLFRLQWIRPVSVGLISKIFWNSFSNFGDFRQSHFKKLITTRTTSWIAIHRTFRYFHIVIEWFYKTKQPLIPGSISYLFKLFGSILSGWITEPIGRKRAMFIVNTPHLIAWTLLHYSSTLFEIYAAHALFGFGVGLMEAPIVTYVGEIWYGRNYWIHSNEICQRIRSIEFLENIIW